MALLAGSHAVDDMYQGALPALPPFFIADRHYSYAAATGLTFAATALSSVIQPVFSALTDRCKPALAGPGRRPGPARRRLPDRLHRGVSEHDAQW